MTFKPHWTSGEDTYVTEPPDQLQSRGYLPDDVPTAEETNWIFRNLMPVRAGLKVREAAAVAQLGQMFLCNGESLTPITTSSSGQVCFSGISFIVQSGAAEVKAYDLAGTLLWTKSLTAYFTSGIFGIQSDGDVVVVTGYTSGGSGLSKAVALEADDGEVRWAYTWNSGASSQVYPTLVGRSAISGNCPLVLLWGNSVTGGTYPLRALNTADGTLSWEIDVDSVVSSAVSCNGRIYVACAVSGGGGDLTTNTKLFSLLPQALSATLEKESALGSASMLLATDGKNLYGLDATDVARIEPISLAAESTYGTSADAVFGLLRGGVAGCDTALADVSGVYDASCLPTVYLGACRAAMSTYQGLVLQTSATSVSEFTPLQRSVFGIRRAAPLSTVYANTAESPFALYFQPL